MIWLLLSLLTQPPGPSACDATLWQHVYHPSRLKVLQTCLTVTGTIADATANKKHPDPHGVRHEADGDTHGWLALDPQWQKLLLPGNVSDEGGNLVYEAVCQFRVTQFDAKAACKGFTSRVVLQPVGTRVSITGTYVQDLNHAQWSELHPVTQISPIR